MPNAWNARDHSDASHRGTVAWYRKDFVLPSRDAALGWKLRFESVNYRAKVWLNGVLLGEHEFAYVPFELPTTGLVRNGVNRLVVRVDNRRTRADIPRGYERPNGRPGGGWWNYGGILREVYLRKFEGVDVESVQTETEIADSQQRAWVRVRARLENPGTRDTRLLMRWRFGDRQSFSQPITVRAGGTRIVRQTFEVTEPRLWYPGAPELYPVGIDAVSDDGDRRLAGYRLHVGIREIRVSDDGILLVNGRKTKLLGANIHEERRRRGAALRPKDRLADMQLYRDLGATLIRAHYPLHPQYLELADRLRDHGLGRGAGLRAGLSRVPGAGRDRQGTRVPAGDGRARQEPRVRARVEHRERAVGTDDRRPGGLHQPGRRPAARPRPDPASHDRHLRLAAGAADGRLPQARRDWDQQLLRLVPGAERVDRVPPAARAVPRSDARVLPRARPVRDRVRRRVEP